MRILYYFIRYTFKIKFRFSILFLIYFYPLDFGFAESILIDDLVMREGKYYKIFSNTPFTGHVTGILNGKIKDGKWEGIWKHFYKNGPLGSKIYYENGKKEGPFETYHGNGQVLSRGNYKNGLLHGILEIYDIHGKLKVQRFFKNGSENIQK
ncbi:MAG: hypothetical protein CMM67_08585 [Rhodospirillaceae bacterium]|nr:hypothetical protein [Rhodospirillaceae bacterium]OUT77272.1 MAG: hypothetical protein CBB83_08765 [Rhodospirillaceae bacterium TMED23]|tara:strand:+ start:4423 stop:4878 length:456 start_codon:yes stop_codon:yes gene_type:complete